MTLSSTPDQSFAAAHVCCIARGEVECLSVLPMAVAAAVAAGPSKRAIRRQRKKDNRRLVSHTHSQLAHTHTHARPLARQLLTPLVSVSPASTRIASQRLSVTDAADSDDAGQSDSHTAQPASDSLAALTSSSPPAASLSADDTALAVAAEWSRGAEADSELSASFRSVIDRFNARLSSKDDLLAQQLPQPAAVDTSESGEYGGAGLDSDDEATAAAGENASGPSRRQQRSESRLSLSELKALTGHPALVEPHDCNSADPRLLVALKAVNSAVPVPPHWQAKRKYLANKRGYEKPPFALPAFLADTGIASMRGVQLSKEQEKTGKAKQRERMRPKMGAIDIDYSTLHDAFFRYQTKPALSSHGELYYEGREFESHMAQASPLHYSQQLVEAVGMAAPDAPPPWLSAMQRYGPPPAYPFLRVPGVNGPLPVGQRWGLAEGEWGKPPVDDSGRPLWGGELFGEAKHNSRERKVQQLHWGHIHSSHDDGDDQEEADKQAETQVDVDETDGDRSETAVGGGSVGVFHSSGVSSVLPPGGLSTPAAINLRKHVDGAGTETPNTVSAGHASHHQQLFTVLDEQPTTDRGAGLLPLSHTYHIASVDEPHSDMDSAAAERERRRRAGRVEVALDPSELDSLDAQSLKRKYDQQHRQQHQQQQRLQTAEDDDEPGSSGGGGGTSSISKEVDETARKKRKKEAQQQKFRF